MSFDLKSFDGSAFQTVRGPAGLTILWETDAGEAGELTADTVVITANNGGGA